MEEEEEEEVSRPVWECFSSHDIRPCHGGFLSLSVAIARLSLCVICTVMPGVVVCMRLCGNAVHGQRLDERTETQMRVGPDQGLACLWLLDSWQP